MIIQVEMKNWRAYDHKIFNFKPGLNFILGSNGKGKTSILEAVSYGLTGEVSVVENISQLLRNPDEPATVKLIFSVKEKTYLIERTQLPERAGEASLYDIATNKRLAFYHKNVNSKVEELLGVSTDFLQRIIYMAEGDVFLFLKQPPGKALNEQVQRVLGLTQLDQFKDAIKLAKTRLRDDSKILKTIQQRVSELSADGIALGDIVVELGNKREILLKQVLEIQDELSHFEAQYKKIYELSRKIAESQNILIGNKEYWNNLQQQPLLEYFDEFQQKIIEQQENISELEKILARFKGQRDSLDKVLELVSVIMDTQIQVDCPVCKKPMTTDERLQVIQDTNDDIGRVDNAISDLEREASSAKRLLKETSFYLEALREIRNLIVHNQFSKLAPQMSIPEIIKALTFEKEKVHAHDLQDRMKVANEQLRNIETERANYLTLQSQLQQQGFSTPEDVVDKLVQIETRQISLGVASTAVEKTLADLRDVQLTYIYRQIAEVWNNFLRHGKWQLRIDQEGKPILVEKSDREFEFSQFSGGEKTALLVVVHTIIAHYFSGCSFLLVDEPLEHLDQANRRSLMRFFIAASKNNFFQQALITTYEESLVRKYISDANVNILHVEQ
jgi:DNA repair exonuclease SbcCD ATPase subunit